MWGTPKNLMEPLQSLQGRVEPGVMWEKSLLPQDSTGTGAWSLSAAEFLLMDQPAGLKEPDINWSWTETLKGWKQGNAGASLRNWFILILGSSIPFLLPKSPQLFTAAGLSPPHGIKKGKNKPLRAPLALARAVGCSRGVQEVRWPHMRFIKAEHCQGDTI